MSQKTPLPEKLRIIFERYGVIKPPTVPPLGELAEQIKKREMALALNIQDSGLCQAEITVKGFPDSQTFTQIADGADLAVALAFGEALTAAVPRQASIFDTEQAEESPEGTVTVHEADFTLLAIPEEAPEDHRDESHAQMIARALGLSGLELADLLVEHGHAVYWYEDDRAVMEVDPKDQDQDIEHETLSHWVGEAINRDPVLTGVELDLYRLTKSGKPPTNDFGRELAAKAFDLKATHYDRLRLKAREEQQAAIDAGDDWLAEYLGESADRRAKQMVAHRQQAEQLRAIKDEHSDDSSDTPDE